MMTVDANKPWKTVADVTAAMKAKGEKASYGTGAPASVVMGEIYKHGTECSRSRSTTSTRRRDQ